MLKAPPTGLLTPDLNGTLLFTAMNQDSEQCVDAATVENTVVEDASTFNLLLQNVNTEDSRILVRPSQTTVTVEDNDGRLQLMHTGCSFIAREKKITTRSSIYRS